MTDAIALYLFAHGIPVTKQNIARVRRQAQENPALLDALARGVQIGPGYDPDVIPKRDKPSL